MDKSDGINGASAAADSDENEKSSAAIPTVMTTDDGTGSTSAQVLQEASENKDNGNPGIITENMDENETGSDTEPSKNDTESSISDTESSELDSESSESDEESLFTGNSIAHYQMNCRIHGSISIDTRGIRSYRNFLRDTPLMEIMPHPCCTQANVSMFGQMNNFVSGSASPIGVAQGTFTNICFFNVNVPPTSQGQMNEMNARAGPNPPAPNSTVPMKGQGQMEFSAGENIHAPQEPNMCPLQDEVTLTGEDKMNVPEGQNVRPPHANILPVNEGLDNIIDSESYIQRTNQPPNEDEKFNEVMEPPKKFLKVNEPIKNYERARRQIRVTEDHSMTTNVCDKDDMPLDFLQDADMPMNEVITGSMNIGADADIGDIAKPDTIDEKATISMNCDDQMKEDGAGNKD